MEEPVRVVSVGWSGQGASGGEDLGKGKIRQRVVPGGPIKRKKGRRTSGGRDSVGDSV